MFIQRLQNYNHILANIVVFSFFAFVLIFNKGYHFGALLLPLLALCFFWLPTETKADKRIPLALIIIGCIWSLHSYFDIYRAGDAERSAKIMLAGITLYFLLKIGVRFQVVFVGVASGAYGAFFVAVYDKLVFGLSRAQGDNHPIIFGNISIMLGLMSLAAGLLLLKEKKYTAIFLLLAALAGLMASFLSGSRGGWIGLPIILLFIFFHARALFSWKQTMTLLITAMAAVLLLFFIPETGVKDRLEDARKDLHGYYYENKKNSSLGARIEMWRSAYHIFLEQPLTGVGKSQVSVYEETLIKEKEVHWVVRQYSHAHSDYLDSLSQRGLLGFFTLLLFYFGCFYLFCMRINSSQESIAKALGMMGAVGTLCYVTFSLTESMLSKNMGISFFIFAMIFVWAAMDSLPRQEKTGGQPVSQ